MESKKEYLRRILNVTKGDPGYGICQTVNPGTKISISGNDKELFKTSNII